MVNPVKPVPLGRMALRDVRDLRAPSAVLADKQVGTSDEQQGEDTA